MSIYINLAEISAFYVIFYSLFRAFSRHLTSEVFQQKWRITSHAGLDIACKLVSGLFATASSSLGIYLMTRNEIGTHPYLRHLFLSVIAYFTYDVHAMYLVVTSDSKRNGRNSLLYFVQNQPLMVLHHLAIGMFFTPLMMTQMDHDPGELMIACALIFEASTPFVSMRAILAHLNLKKSMLYILNGMAMVVVFLCCRILVYPWFYVAYARQRSISVWSAVQKPPWTCNLFLLVVILPQIYWFNVMLKGAVKVVHERNSRATTKQLLVANGDTNTNTTSATKKSD